MLNTAIVGFGNYAHRLVSAAQGKSSRQRKRVSMYSSRNLSLWRVRAPKN